MMNSSADRFARTLPVHKPSARRLAKELQDVVAEKTKGHSGALGDQTLLAGEPYEILDARGWSKTVYVVLLARRMNARAYVHGGGYGHAPDGKPVVVLLFNGSVPASELHRSAAGSDLIASQFYKTLIHELGHASDPGIRPTYTAGPGVDAAFAAARGRVEHDPRTHYAQRKEVSAYLINILDELSNILPAYERFVKLFGKSEGLSVMLKQSETWRLYSPYWSPRDRKRVVNAVLRNVEG